MGSNRPLATAIPIPVLITYTLGLATSTGSTLVVLAHAMELDQAVTAISLLARTTRTTEHATATKHTSGVLARVFMELNHRRVSVIPLIVPIMLMLVLATST